MSKNIKNTKDLKFIVTVESSKNSSFIKTIGIKDTRTNKELKDDYINKRGITNFSDLKDLKETLNWNLNGCSMKYTFRWCGTTKNGNSIGTAYVFN